jgi:hypothetical protein
MVLYSRFNISTCLMVLLILVFASHSVDGKSVFSRTAPGIQPSPTPPRPKTETSKAIPPSLVEVNPTEAVAKNVASTYLSSAQDFFHELTHGSLTGKEVLFTLLAIVAVALSFSAMIVEASLLVDFLAWTCIILGPSAAILQRIVWSRD